MINPNTLLYFFVVLADLGLVNQVCSAAAFFSMGLLLTQSY